MSTETDAGEVSRPQINVTPDADTLRRLDRFRAPSGAKRATAALALLRRALDTIDAEQRLHARTCTGVTARWCSIHGDCRCGGELDLCDPACPLHAPDSDHGEARPAALPVLGRLRKLRARHRRSAR